MNKDLPYIVLGTYKPKKMNCSRRKKCSIIGKDLVSFTENLGLIPFKNDEIKRNRKAAWSDYDLHAEVRRLFKEGSEGTEFHQDGDTSTDDMNCGLILWANHSPTEFLYRGKIYQAKPFELVYVNNLDCYHRRPSGIPKGRLHFRQRVEVPRDINLI